MTISYLLAPIPKWVLINNVGTVAGGGKLYTYDSLDRTVPKAVFQDAGGLVPWTNPILFDENGTQGPFYWQVDSTMPNDNYYLVAYDANDQQLWEILSYVPPGSGGGGDTTTVLPLANYITNNQFINHTGDTTNPTNATNLVIAPSNHKGFTPALINPVIGTYGVVGPDIRFIKNASASPATDQITFPLFDFTDDPLMGDVTPVRYVRYQCTNSPSNESYKSFQFPITQKVKNLSNQSLTFTLWAAVTTTPVDINIYTRQYYGNGTAATPESGATRVNIATWSLTSVWTKFVIPFTMTTVAGNSIGTLGSQTDDDAVYIQIDMPLGQPCDVLFTKPCLFLGNISQNEEFDIYDEIDSIDSTPRTGDVRISLTSSAPLGWLPMNDGTIGNTGATPTPTLAQGDYTFQLYKTLWDGVSNAYAPVTGGRGSSAISDFLAGKSMRLPLSLGHALAGAGASAYVTAHVLGENGGAESSSITLSTPNLPAHTHSLPYQVGGGSVASGGSTNVQFLSGGSTTGSTGDGTAFNVPIIPPTSYMNVFIKL